MIFYFNHSAIECIPSHEVESLLLEIVELRTIIKKLGHQVFFYQNFWEAKLEKVDIATYLYQKNDRDPLRVIIDSIVNGPHYSEQDNNLQLTITPDVQKHTFAEKILYICFQDKQDNILSLTLEKIMSYYLYKIEELNNANQFLVNNYLGLTALQKYFEESVILKNINDVFDEIKKKSDKIVFLDNALKSARKHDFRGHFQEVYSGILCLESIELRLLQEGKNDEIRKKSFYETSGLEISGETNATLDERKYRQQREFNIPEIGINLFEWHIKIDGNRTRIHYYIDKRNDKIYIGHCGKHLGTSDYNS